MNCRLLLFLVQILKGCLSLSAQHSSILNRLAKKLRIEHWQIIAALLMAYDGLVILVAYFLALWLRFDATFSAIPSNY
ncbi:MAG: hypothetical protein IJ189_04925, partial [Clostridia bacterium]|nr:hypothetical protein [Clostridia bacterium]